MPPFQRKTLILIGAQGVGRRSLKNRLIVLNPLLFGTTVPCRFNNYSWSTCLSHSLFSLVNLSCSTISHKWILTVLAVVPLRNCGEILILWFPALPSVTSRRPREEEKDGQSYCFMSRADMEMDIKAGRYLEHGEYDGNLYGTKIDSIHEVVNAGRTCILDVNPQVSRTGSYCIWGFLDFVAVLWIWPIKHWSNILEQKLTVWKQGNLWSEHL